MKLCSSTKCDEINPQSLGNFYVKKNGKLSSNCKVCIRKTQIQYSLSNKDKIKESNIKYRSNNKYYFVEYHIKNKNAINRKRKQLSLTVEDKERRKNYVEANKDRVLEYLRKYRKNRWESDPIYKLKCILRMRLRKAIKSKNFVKNAKTLEILGCSVEFLKQYLESKFQPGMSWDNHGSGNDKWNIDHRVPLASAKTAEELYILNHYTNLQPLWQLDNIIKSDSLNPNL